MYFLIALRITTYTEGRGKKEKKQCKFHLIGKNGQIEAFNVLYSLDFRSSFRWAFFLIKVNLLAFNIFKKIKLCSEIHEKYVMERNSL